MLFCRGLCPCGAQERHLLEHSESCLVCSKVASNRMSLSLAILLLTRKTQTIEIYVWTAFYRDKCTTVTISLCTVSSALQTQIISLCLGINNCIMNSFYLSLCIALSLQVFPYRTYSLLLCTNNFYFFLKSLLKAAGILV